MRCSNCYSEVSGATNKCPVCGQLFDSRNAKKEVSGYSNKNSSNGQSKDSFLRKYGIYQHDPDYQKNKKIGFILIGAGCLTFIISWFFAWFIMIIATLVLVAFAVVMFRRALTNVNGELTVSDKMVCYQLHGITTKMELDKISSIEQKNDEIKLFYRGAEHVFYSASASSIVSCINEKRMINTSSYNVNPVITNEQHITSKADEIKKYKELLDSGALTQEQYNIMINKLL